MRVRIHLRNQHFGGRQRALRWAALLFFLAGCCALAVCAMWYWQTRSYQQAQLATLPLPATSVSAGEWNEPRHSLKAQAGQSIGRIDIARLGISAVIVEGVTPRNLRLAVGHVPGTALPGDGGNVVVAGHRDTFFRNLKHIRAGDAISLTTPSASYRYIVEAAQIVAPTDVSQIAVTDVAKLTLVTCYPFYFVGPAPRRFVVRAQQIVEDAKR